MSRRFKVLLIIGGIAFFSTIAIYAIIHPIAFPSTILGLCFLLYAESIFFGGAALIDFWSTKISKLLLWSGIGIPLSIYSTVVFISSLVFISAHTTVVRGFWVLQIVFFVIFAAICLIVGNFSIGAKMRDGKMLDSEGTIRYNIEQLLLIREQIEKKTDVDKLIDGLRFSDTSVTADADVEIKDAIIDLKSLVQSEEASEDGFSKAVQSISFLIKKRNLQIRNLKHGNI